MTIVAQRVDGPPQRRDEGLTGVGDGVWQLRAGEGIMGPRPTAPPGRVREPLVIAATFGPLVLLRLLLQRDVQVKCSFFFFFFRRVRKIFYLKSKKKKLKGDAM